MRTRNIAVLSILATVYEEQSSAGGRCHWCRLRVLQQMIKRKMSVVILIK